MEEISITRKDVLANWKCTWAKTQGKEKELGQYTKLPYSIEELETAIKKELPKGGVLRTYAEINTELEEKFGNSVYDEIIRLYELCEETGCFFDISEVEELLQIAYKWEWSKEIFIQKCMNLLLKAPVKIQDKNKLYDIQYHLFCLGKEKEVWYAYQQKQLFPKEMLKKLYQRLEEKKLSKEKVSKVRMNWLTTWLSSSD